MSEHALVCIEEVIPNAGLVINLNRAGMLKEHNRPGRNSSLDQPSDI